MLLFWPAGCWDFPSPTGTGWFSFQLLRFGGFWGGECKLPGAFTAAAIQAVKEVVRLAILALATLLAALVSLGLIFVNAMFQATIAALQLSVQATAQIKWDYVPIIDLELPFLVMGFTTSPSGYKAAEPDDNSMRINIIACLIPMLIPTTIELSQGLIEIIVHAQIGVIISWFFAEIVPHYIIKFTSLSTFQAGLIALGIGFGFHIALLWAAILAESIESIAGCIIGAVISLGIALTAAAAYFIWDHRLKAIIDGQGWAPIDIGEVGASFVLELLDALLNMLLIIVALHFLTLLQGQQQEEGM